MSQAMRGFLLVLAVVSLPLWAAAIDPYVFDNPEQEARFKALSAELRCLVCQNQSIGDSNAELAQDLRREIYGMIKTGLSDKEIVDFMVDRYGDFVLYRPPVKSSTMLLWLGPFVMVVVGLIALVVYIRRRTQEPKTQEAELSAEERARFEALVQTENKQADS